MSTIRSFGRPRTAGGIEPLSLKVVKNGVAVDGASIMGVLDRAAMRDLRDWLIEQLGAEPTTPGKDTIPCSRCSGTGCVDLPPELKNTLNVLRGHGALTSMELRGMLNDPPSATAIVNRLTDLRTLGLVARHWVSRRMFIYEAVDAPGRRPR